ncbi:MAG: type II secretion system F family protein [Verrucomicrobia bacterium]|nr:type II secretion system F family protein [Verrucomicrobiota bacterium]
MVRQLDLAAFYRQLAAMLNAGVSMERALQSLKRAAPGGRLRRVSAAVGEHIRVGGDLAEAMGEHEWVFPQLHRELVRIGERTGTVDRALRQLAEMMEQMAAIRKEVWAQMLYPLLLLHLSVVLGPLPMLVFTRDYSAYGRAILSSLAFLYVVAVIIWWIIRRVSKNRSKLAFADRLVLVVPVVGKIHRDLSLARLFSALKALLNAGIGILEAMPRAGAASGSATLAAAACAAVPELKRGESLVTAMGGALPPNALGLIATGQESGKLDDMLDHLERHFFEESRRRLRAMAEWLPKLIYVSIVFWVGWQILQMGCGYGRMLSGVLNK